MSSAYRDIVEKMQAERERLLAEIARKDEALRRADGHIRLMQRDVLAFLPPDSTMSEADLVNLLIERLDGPEQREVQALTSAALQPSETPKEDK